MSEIGNKRIAKNTIFLYGRLIVTLLISLYTARAILDVLGVTDYGIYNVVAGFVSMFGFLNTSMVNSVQRFYNYEKGKGNFTGLRSVYNVSVRVQLVIALATFLLLEGIGVWYINNQMVLPIERIKAANWVFQFSAFSLILVILQVPFSAAMISHEKMNMYAIIGMVDSALKLIFILLLPKFKYDTLVLYGLSIFLISILNFIVYLFYSRTYFDELKLERGFSWTLFKKMATFSGWNIFDSFSYIIHGQGLNILINAFFGPVANAARGIAYQIQGVIFTFSSNLSIAFKPQLVEGYAAKDYKRTETLFFYMSKACFIMQYILSIPILFELDYILPLWLGNNIPEDTCVFTRLILINAIINSLNMPMSQVVQATGMIKRYQVIRSVVNISVIPLSYIALHIIDNSQVVFWVMILVTIIMQPLSLILLHKVFDFSYKGYWINILRPAILCAILIPIPVAFCICYLQPSFLRLLLTILITIVAAIFFSWFFFLSESERVGIKMWINKRFSQMYRR